MPSPTTGTSLQELRTRLQQALGDSYRIERELGGGGMSHVFLATEASLNRHVVIKVLPPEMVSEVSSARFKREMEVTAQLHHPHILPVLSAGAKDDVMYYVMPYVEGESLRHRLTREGQLPIMDALRILREIADALAFAHRHGVVHRDIKPENILLESDHAFLADFGVARALINAGGENLTGTGMAVGTQGYMAPEQLSGERNIDARADVYALALVGYELLAGHSPFTGVSAKAVAAAHLMTPAAPVIEARPDVPLRASKAIARALQKEPDDRFQTAGAFRDELEAAAASVVAGRPSGRGVPVAGTQRRRAAIGAAAVLLVGALAAAAFVFHGRGSGSLDQNVVVVAPFNVLNADLSLWKEGVVDVLARNLDGAGPLRTISPSAVMRGWSGHADRETTRDLARRTGAGVAVFGTLEKFGRDSVRATVNMLNANSGTVLSELRRTEHADRMDRLVDSLTVGLLRELGRTRPVGDVRLAGVGSNSLPALKAFLQGEQYFRRTVFDSAAAGYEQAVALDSTFALALYRAGTVRGWVHGVADTLAAALTSRAASHLQGVGARDSLIILSDSLGRSIALSNENIVRNPTLPERFRRLWEITRLLAERYPADPDAWYAIGEAQFHHGTRLGRRESRREILNAFDRAIAADSGYAPAYIHAIQLAYEIGSVEDGLRYVRAYNRLASSDVYASAMQVVEHITDPALARTVATQQLLDRAPGEVLQTASLAVWRTADSTESALRLVRAGEQRGSFRMGVTSRDIPTIKLEQLMQRGRLSEARKEVERDPRIVTRRSGPYLVAEAAWFDLWPASAIQNALKAIPDTSLPVAAVLAITTRDTARMTAARQRLLPRADSGFARAQDLVALLDALVALRAADTASALEKLRNVQIAIDDDPLPRMIKAELLFAKGKTAEALEVVRDGSDKTGIGRIMMTLLRGRIAEVAGERALAVESYLHVTQMWRAADPELQRFVEQARAGLKRLGADEKAAIKLE